MAHHNRCNICGKDFDEGGSLKEHVERRHPKADVHWWMVAENPEKELQFEGR
ncbi:C2H2-type zinc finger protein [Haloarchaeobius sp. HME9146]|uniref:C2H2-type zinc finger protein n=1 Tax=unclassified Haloarchaeobius TaxID=2614452 RepID=UPI0021C1737E|nr:C2H2-type zinc finger protein [Haloarchaeobius sp. HME9146]MCT9097904.1 C2H2-type zinc finger protein [Haloarchaeobius sp. HME9146]